jgi:hypothetical protein
MAKADEMKATVDKVVSVVSLLYALALSPVLIL